MESRPTGDDHCHLYRELGTLIASHAFSMLIFLHLVMYQTRLNHEVRARFGAAGDGWSNILAHVRFFHNPISIHFSHLKTA